MMMVHQQANRQNNGEKRTKRGVSIVSGSKWIGPGRKDGRIPFLCAHILFGWRTVISCNSSRAFGSGVKGRSEGKSERDRHSLFLLFATLTVYLEKETKARVDVKRYINSCASIQFNSIQAAPVTSQSPPFVAHFIVT